MQIKVNDIPYTFDENELSIAEILDKLRYTFPIIIVKHNDKVINSENFDNYLIYDNDEIIILHIFAGG